MHLCEEIEELIQASGVFANFGNFLYAAAENDYIDKLKPATVIAKLSVGGCSDVLRYEDFIRIAEAIVKVKGLAR